MLEHRLVLATGRASTPRRGAASLVVVMILFFIITLVAAYTSRNLLFEQRTSANQYRSTLAFETAEAGIEWAIARLNEGRLDVSNDCTPSAAITAQPSFRERYLSIDPATGVISLPAPVAPATEKLAGCVFDGTTWVCRCPDGGPPVLPVPAGNGPFPAFWVKFRADAVGGRPGVVRVQVNACTRADANCLNFTNRVPQSGDGQASVWAMVALRSALSTAPAAALTVRGTFAAGPTNTYTVANTDITSGGITIHGGAAVVPPGNLVLQTIPGSPAANSIVQSDPAVELPNLAIVPATPANVGENRMFNSVFGLWPATYFAQPALAVVNCPPDCAAANVNAAIQLRPGHPIHVAGGGQLLINAPIGTPAAPVLIIADGTVVFGTADIVHGVIYSRAPTWELEGGNGTIQGAAIAEGNFAFDADTPSIIYNRDVILRLQHLNGSFAKVAGSWRDYQSTFLP